MKILPTSTNTASKINHAKLKKQFSVLSLLYALLLVCLIASPAAAQSVSWSITPVTPHVGDTITITGKASPGADVKFSVSHDMKLPVINGRYNLVLNGMPVPEWKDSFFTVRAEGVKNLDITDELAILGMHYSLHLDAKANKGGIATINQNDPPFLKELFYNNNIVINGDALKGKSSVLLKVKVDETRAGDSNGKFVLNYDTSTLPTGTYILKIGNKAKTIELKPKLQPPHADFTAVAAGGRTPLKVQFIDKSTGIITSRSWDFNNDGIVDSTAQNPIYTYKIAGKYTVSLMVGNSAGISTKTHILTVKKHGR